MPHRLLVPVGLALAAQTVAGAAVFPTAVFTVGATVQNGCVVTSAPTLDTGLAFGQINFGSFPALAGGNRSAALSMTGGVQALLLCTAGVNVRLTLDAGQHADGLQRRLSNGSRFLPYSLNLTSAGNPPVVPLVPIGISVGSTAQALPLQASITLPATGVAAGTYTDTVQVTVSW